MKEPAAPDHDGHDGPQLHEGGLSLASLCPPIGMGGDLDTLPAARGRGHGADPQRCAYGCSLYGYPVVRGTLKAEDGLNMKEDDRGSD